MDKTEKTDARFKSPESQRLTREIDLTERAAKSLNLELRTFDMAFSSEEPYTRWFWNDEDRRAEQGSEVLSHEKKHVNLKRMNSGAALLLNHWSDDQVGAFMPKSITLDDGIARGTVKISRSQRGEEILNDVQDGIRTKASVGYIVHEYKREAPIKEGALPVYRATNWEPLEASLVAVPADNTVGVGREADGDSKVVVSPIVNNTPTSEDRAMEQDKTQVGDTTPQGSAVPPDNVVTIEAANAAKEAERKRVNDIHEVANRFPKQDGIAEATKTAIDSGQDIGTFAIECFQRDGKAKPIELVDDPSKLGLSEKEVKEYSFVRLIRAVSSQRPQDAPYEMELSASTAERTGKSPKGVFIPRDILSTPLKRDLTAATAGAQLIATDLLSGSFIDLLRNMQVVRGLGAAILGGLVGDIAIPRHTTASTAFWLAESDAITESTQVFDQVTMTPKTVGAMTDITRKLIQQSSIDIEAFVRNELATTLAVELDRAAINGSGASNQPTGILNQSGIGDVAIGTNGGAPTWETIVQIEREVAVLNALFGNLAMLTNNNMRSRLKTTEKASGTAQFIWPNGNEVNGYPIATTQNVPNDLVKGTSSDCSAIILGNFADLLIGEWGALDLLVNPFSFSNTGVVRITTFWDTDIAVRHPESFAATQDARDI